MPDEDTPPEDGTNTPAPDATGDQDKPGTPGTSPDGGLDTLPESWRKEIKEARSEAAKYRTRVRELEPFEVKAREAEEATKSEIQRAAEQQAAAERRATDAEARAMRLEVAASKGLTAAQAKRLVGSTVEELSSDADDLLAEFKPQEGDTKKPPGQPTERLSGGIDPTEQPSEVDGRKIAATIPRY